MTHADAIGHTETQGRGDGARRARKQPPVNRLEASVVLERASCVTEGKASGTSSTQRPQHALRRTEARRSGRQDPLDQAHYREAAVQPAMARSSERPSDVHAVLSGDVWMVDHNGATVLRCQCLAASATKVRLCVPVGYGVAVGQRYELSARHAGQNPFSSLWATATFWVTVVQTRKMPDEDSDRIDVAVAVDQMEVAPTFSLPRALT
jgi:hypothetical protein